MGGKSWEGREVLQSELEVEVVELLEEVAKAQDSRLLSYRQPDMKRFLKKI